MGLVSLAERVVGVDVGVMVIETESSLESWGVGVGVGSVSLNDIDLTGFDSSEGKTRDSP